MSRWLDMDTNHILLATSAQTIYTLGLFGSTTRVTRINSNNVNITAEHQDQRKCCPSQAKRVLPVSRGVKCCYCVCLWCPCCLWCRMWQFSIFIGIRCKYKTIDIWLHEQRPVCPRQTRLLLSDNNTRRLACKAGLLMLRMSVKLTRVTLVLLPNGPMGLLPDT